MSSNPDIQLETLSNNELGALAQHLTGYSLEQKNELRMFLKKQHESIHSFYGLPSDDLMKPGNQQQYCDQLTALIEKENFIIRFEKTKSGLAGEFSPFLWSVSSDQPPKQYQGAITINPERINIHDGIEMGRILGHEYIHVKQNHMNRHNVLNSTQREFEGYVGSIIIDDSINLTDLFSALARSISAPCSESRS